LVYGLLYPFIADDDWRIPEGPVQKVQEDLDLWGLLTEYISANDS
jgi:hypothetical protein